MIVESHYMITKQENKVKVRSNEKTVLSDEVRGSAASVEKAIFQIWQTRAFQLR